MRGEGRGSDNVTRTLQQFTTKRQGVRETNCCQRQLIYLYNMIKDECQKCYERAAWVGLYAALGLAVFKNILGFITGSVALNAHGLHSFADFLSRGITLMSVKISLWKPNSRFPYGYGKVQFLSSLFIGALLLVGSLVFLFDNIRHLSKGLIETPDYAALAGGLISALAGEILYRYLRCVGEKNNSPAMLASAFENRVDAITSLAIVGGVILAVMGWPAADHVAAILIALTVVKVGFDISKDGIAGLMDISIPDHVLDKVRHIVTLSEGVTGIASLRGRRLGDSWELDLEITAEGEKSLSDSYGIVGELKQKIMNEVLHTGDVRITIAPC